MFINQDSTSLSYDYINYFGCPPLKYRLIFLHVLKVFDEPSGESDAERLLKVSPGISK